MSRDRNRFISVDYHGLSAAEALVHFACDYRRFLNGRNRGKKLRIIHGYGATGTGGIIKKSLHVLLDFQEHKGTLSYRSADGIGFDAGYTDITAKKQLCRIPLGLLASSFSAKSECCVVEGINQRISRHASEATNVADSQPLAAIPPALASLDSTPFAPKAVLPRRKPKSFAELYGETHPPGPRNATGR